MGGRIARPEDPVALDTLNCYICSMICSTLSGHLAIKHPTLPVMVRDDGLILNRVQGSNHSDFRYEYTPGCLDKRCGYYVIRILGKLFQAHRVVAEAFHANPENKPTVDHINRVRDDNRACNLRWATRHEQNENSGIVLNRMDYGVRRIEDRNQYNINWRLAHLEECRAREREYMRKRRAKKKEERLAAALPEEQLPV